MAQHKKEKKCLRKFGSFSFQSIQLRSCFDTCCSKDMCKLKHSTHVLAWWYSWNNSFLLINKFSSLQTQNKSLGIGFNLSAMPSGRWCVGLSYQASIGLKNRWKYLTEKMEKNTTVLLKFQCFHPRLAQKRIKALSTKSKIEINLRRCHGIQSCPFAFWALQLTKLGIIASGMFSQFPR